MHKLIGQSVKCTLDDGRTATGTFVCLDRLRNIILSDVLEERPVPASVYGGDSNTILVAERQLAQAMIPGAHLVKVEITKDVHEQYVVEQTK
jgi:small nuclear ribonucleoprotein (snRNP)-like protein